MLARYRITPISPLMTPMMSDTIFGHFCWALEQRRGAAHLEAFLASFDGESKAPVLFSSAFPAEHLPRPVLPPPTEGERRELVENYFLRGTMGNKDNASEKQLLLNGWTILKAWRRRRLISLEDWLALKDGYSELGFLERLANRQEPMEEIPQTINTVETSNTISRASGQVTEESGGLFVREKQWFTDGAQLDLYVAVNEADLVDDVEWFLCNYLPQNGFGKDKSIGMGALSIVRDTAFDETLFDTPGANAQLALSLTAFDGMGALPARYDLCTKFGKLGGTFAVCGPEGGNPRPFKKPLLMIQPGGVFFTLKPLDKASLLADVHSDARIRHCGIPVTVPLIVKEVERYVH